MWGGGGTLSDTLTGVSKITASAEEISVPVGTGTTTLTYEYLEDGTIEITSCDIDVEGELEILSEIDGVEVTSIGACSFYYCTSLTSITIPDRVTSIGYWAFGCCTSLTSIATNENSKYYSSIDGVLFDKNQTELICYPGGKEGEYTIPDNVTSIGERAFEYCTSLTSITIPDSVTSIGAHAFSGTPWLEEKQNENPLVIVNNILIDGGTCEGDVEIPSSVTSIGNYAFSYCERLTAVTIPDSVTDIGECAFYSCSSLTAVTILYPNCEIYDDRSTISISWDAPSEGCKYTGIIYGYTDSTAHTYAEKYGYTFESLGEALVTTTTIATNTTTTEV